VYALCPDLWAVLPDGRIKWKRPVGWARGMVIDPNGTVYVNLDDGVRAIDAEGAPLWQWSLQRSTALVSALAGDELLVVEGAAIHRLEASTGRLRSSVTPPAPPRTMQQLVSPVIDGAGVLYVMANAVDADSFQPQTQATIYAIDRADGILWTAPFNRALNAAGANLAIGPGRTLYFTIGGTLRAIGP
jgi:outer membrane protein assembly factor BamB